jgi:hypothetical protein
MPVRKPFLALVACCLVLLLSGCFTQTVRFDAAPKDASEPQYEETLDFYLWGFFPSHVVDVQRVCAGRPASQLQSRTTFVNGLLNLITLGIYSPRSARVWCKSSSVVAPR